MNDFFDIHISIEALKSKILDPNQQVTEGFLGFYHENDLATVELQYLEQRGCELYGKTLEEIRMLGNDFLVEIMHPDDVGRCLEILFDFASKKDENKILTYNQRLKLYGEEQYTLYFTCVKVNLEKNIFQCVTTPMTNINAFYSEVNTILESSEYVENHVKLYTSFSKREKEVMKLVCQGKTAEQIADILFLSPHTVVKHKKNIYKKGGFNSKLKLMEFAVNFNIIGSSS